MSGIRARSREVSPNSEMRAFRERLVLEVWQEWQCLVEFAVRELQRQNTVGCKKVADFKDELGR
jgi:hypothetical protein